VGSAEVPGTSLFDASLLKELFGLLVTTPWLSELLSKSKQ